MPVLTKMVEKTEDVAQLPQPEQHAVAVAALKCLGANSEQAARDAITSAGVTTVIGPPGRSISQILWLLVVSAFVLIFIGSAAAVAYFVSQNNESVGTVLSLFTATVGFLAGLFAPSPVAASGNSSQNKPGP